MDMCGARLRACHVGAFVLVRFLEQAYTNKTLIGLARQKKDFMLLSPQYQHRLAVRVLRLSPDCAYNLVIRKTIPQINEEGT
jgi:hypothetical protein